MANKPKLFLYVQHLLGIGHQMRAAALCRAAQQRGFEVHYISGGFPEKLPDLGNAIFHQLPPTRIKDGDFNQLVDKEGQSINDIWWDQRKTIILDLFQDIKPDLILLEGFPFARRKFQIELLPLLEKAKEQNIPCATSLRDILVDPIKGKKRQFAIETSQKYLDFILIHGEENLTPLAHSFPGTEILQNKLVYTGYIDPQFDRNHSNTPSSISTSKIDILVSAGGGAAGSQLYLNSFEAFQHNNDHTDYWHFLIGPNCPQNTQNLLSEKYKKLSTELKSRIKIEPARPDFRQLLQTCHISISQAGYNTVMDLLNAPCQAILIPFSEGNESEQSLRANLLAQQPRYEILAEETLTPARINTAINHLKTAHKKSAVDFALMNKQDGAVYSANFLYNFIQ